MMMILNDKDEMRLHDDDEYKDREDEVAAVLFVSSNFLGIAARMDMTYNGQYSVTQEWWQQFVQHQDN